MSDGPSRELKTQDYKSQKFERAGWAVLLILAGIYFLLPYETFPDGMTLLGAGGAMLAYSAIARGMGAALTPFFPTVGIILFVFGGIDYLDVNVEIWPVALIIAGGLMLYRISRERQSD